MKSTRAVLIGLVASLPGLVWAAEAPTDRPSASDPRTWRAALASEARQRHELRPGVELFFSGESERLVAMLRVAGAAAGEGVTFVVPGASGFTASNNGHVRLTVPGGDLAFVRPGAVQDDGTGLTPVFAGWEQAGPGGVRLAFPGHEGKLPLLVRFEVVFLADPKALELYDRNGDQRIELQELVPATPPVAGPQADAVLGGSVTASMVDALVVDAGTIGQANPGDVIGYTTTITATDNTTGLAYDNPIDPDTTLVPASVNVSPLALNDVYAAVGNVTLDVDTTLAGIFGNDREFPFGASSFTLATAGPNGGSQAACGSFPCTVATAGGGTVILKSPGDGRFTYTTPPGVSSGSDTFVYVITDGTLTDTATVTFNIAGRVWFVKADAPGGGTGTQASPFSALTPATVAGVGGAGDVDGPNDYIYLYDTAAGSDYPAGIELEPTQKLVGSGVALVVGSTTVLPAGTPPTLANASGNGVTMSTDTVVRGLTIEAANNAGILAGGSIGTSSVEASVSVVTSSGGTGVSVPNVQSGHTLTFSGSVSGTGSAPAVSITGQDGSLSFAAATISKTSGRLIEVANKSGGTVAFGGATQTGGGANALLVQNNSGGTQVSFASPVSVATTGSGDAVSMQTNNASGGATTTFGGGITVSAGNGRALFANNGGTLTIAGTGSTLSATGVGGALDVSNTTFGGGGATFATVSSSGNATNGVNLVNVSGSVTMNGGAISGTSGTAFNVSQGSSGVSYAGTISKTNSGRVVDVQQRAGGTVAFSGAITATGASTGINVSGATAVSTVNFTGAVDLGTSGTRLTGGTALTVNHGGNASVTSFSDLDVFTTGQDGISASSGGTLNLTTGQVDAGGRALNLDGLALGATLTAVSSSGSSAEGVRLNNASGSLSIGTTSVTGPSTQGILVQGSSATVNFASSGSTTVSGGGGQRILVGTSTGNVTFGNTTVSGGSDGISLQNNSAGTRTFGTLATSGNTGIGFLHAVGGGATSVTGATTITNPGGTGVDIQNSTTSVSFNSVTVNKGASAGTGVSLTSNTTSPSFGALAVTTSNGTGIAISGSGLTTSGGSIASTNGPAISSAAGAFAATFATVSSTNSTTQGINLTGASTGTLTMNGGTLSGSAGTAFNIGGGNAIVTYAGTVTVTNGQSGLVTNNVTGGSLSLNSISVSGTGAGRDAVVLDGTGNAYDVTISSATLNTNSMRHGVALSDLGAGSDVTFSGGTITSTGSGRRVVNFAGPTNGSYTFGNVTLNGDNSDGMALASTQLGTYTFGDYDVDAPSGGVGVSVNGNSAAVTFRSIDQIGGSLGVSLTSTTGSFSVTGNGGACTPATPTCTGGTIGSTTGGDGATAGAGVWLSGASNVSLTRVRLHDHPNFGVRGQNVTSFTLDTSVVNGANGTNAAVNEGSVVFDGLFGASAITHSAISGGIEDNLRVENTTATPLTALNITGTGGSGSTCRITNNNTATGNIGVRVAGFNGAVMTATVSGCVFQGNRTDTVNIDAGNTSVVTSTVTNNLVIAGSGGANQGNLGINVTSAATATHNYTVSGNSVGTDGVTPAPLINTGINLFSGNGSTLGSVAVGFLNTNTVRHAGVGSGHGIQLFADLLSTMRANVNQNVVSNVALDYGLRVESAGDPANAGGNLQVGVTNNNVSVLPSALDSIRVRSRRQTTLCSDIRTNTTNAGGTAGGFVGLFTNRSDTSTFNVEGLAAGAQSAATMQTYLTTQNPAAASVSATGLTYVGVPVNTCSIP